MIKAIHIVYKRPRSNCQKIRQIIWLKPEIEDVSQQKNTDPSHEQALFENIQETQEVELSFSSEVAEIIQLIEQGEDEEQKAHLLPVSSVYVHQPSPEDPDKTASETTTHTEDRTEPTLELIEDWD